MAEENVSTRRNTKKILNNSYKNGDNLKSSEEYEFTRSLSVDYESAEQYMNVDFDFDSMMYQETVDFVNNLIDSDEQLNLIVSHGATSPDDVNFKKYTKDEMNIVFSSIYDAIFRKYNMFFKISYVFQIVCNILSVTHASLFDTLDYENKKCVLIGMSNELGVDITKTKNFVY